MGGAHVPVLEGPVVGGLRPRPGARLVDATIGLGGHAAALLRAAPDTLLLGLDRDAAALARARERLASFGDRVVLREGSFADLEAHIAALAWEGADAILADLGVSSMQLDDPARGFSFRAAGPLDMRMGGGAARTAAEVVNTWDERDLARLLREAGEEPRARAIARAIVRARPIDSTTALADVVARVVGRGKPGHHPATRTFQAIRIAVNDELAALDALLADGWRLLRPGGRIAILAYHSLEDRRVKDAFRRWATGCVCPPEIPRCVCGGVPRARLVTTKALRPDADEIARNPRARSARLRIAERLES
ncbi:MAG TPA: 16S rRNA (cytosine(1402)-N(4))-methyltransferase RsmH [Candidatus Eisenbacteria bacterium]|nr:16S rRNA (cytosine(1402)-N(4))-methyltransferase RsmH [Candidatus Eisenbacteria bacterium]